ncbi:hypothetical protein FGO68_gene8384 [Halteria grandinella]|uniref:Uncharacterized protein n=1 Tax=Halteria grandinella TaxID=5974 RepID=A0A8J8P981_HALGN|nr:hypothetical protein FGO68_gene8384 [Halteria grandinella]
MRLVYLIILMHALLYIQSKFQDPLIHKCGKSFYYKRPEHYQRLDRSQPVSLVLSTKPQNRKLRAIRLVPLKSQTRKSDRVHTGGESEDPDKYHLRDSLDEGVPPPLLLILLTLGTYMIVTGLYD